MIIESDKFVNVHVSTISLGWGWPCWGVTYTKMYDIHKNVMKLQYVIVLVMTNRLIKGRARKSENERKKMCMSDPVNLIGLYNGMNSRNNQCFLN